MSEERDYRKAAEESLELAEVLLGKGKISDQDFLERMARSDVLADHDGETCGMCCKIRLEAQVAREMIAAGEWEDVVSKWVAESQKRWQQTKFFAFWQECRAAGLDPQEEFRKRGWEA
jgi:hypothetical protein